jgi:hypothetical protein
MAASLVVRMSVGQGVSCKPAPPEQRDQSVLKESRSRVHQEILEQIAIDRVLTEKRDTKHFRGDLSDCHEEYSTVDRRCRKTHYQMYRCLCLKSRQTTPYRPTILCQMTSGMERAQPLSKLRLNIAILKEQVSLFAVLCEAPKAHESWLTQLAPRSAVGYSSSHPGQVSRSAWPASKGRLSAPSACGRRTRRGRSRKVERTPYRREQNRARTLLQTPSADLRYCG